MINSYSKSFPSEIQPDAMDCGPVSLKMIAKYYGKEFSLDKLRQLTHYALSVHRFKTNKIRISLRI